MQINDDLETSVAGPTNGPVEVLELALDVGLATRDVPSPVADGDADVVQTGSLDLTEVVLGDPRVPVAPEGRLSCAAVLVLAKGPLVDDAVVTGLVEQRRGDPRLNDEPLHRSALPAHNVAAIVDMKIHCGKSDHQLYSHHLG